MSLKARRNFILIFVMVAILTLSLVLVSCDKTENVSHQHEYGDWEILSNPTLLNKGSIQRYCTVEGCSAREIKEIPRLNSNDYEVIVVSESSYEKEGETKYIYKLDNQNIEILLKVDKVARSYNNWEVKLAPTQDELGLIERVSKDEEHVKETKELPKLDNVRYIEKVIKEPKCIFTGESTFIYKIDNQELEINAITKPLGHKWGKWGSMGNPTRYTYGALYRTCQVCGEGEIKENLLPLNMDSVNKGFYKFEEIKKATCTEEGEGKFILELDGQIITYQASVAKVEHTVGEWLMDLPTEEKEGKRYQICSVCGNRVNESVVPKLTECTLIESKPSTCIEKGYDKYSYILNKETIIFKIDRALDLENGHSYIVGSDPIAPTRDKAGTYFEKCELCGNVHEIELLPLVYENVNNGFYSTLVDNGKLYYIYEKYHHAFLGGETEEEYNNRVNK